MADNPNAKPFRSTAGLEIALAKNTIVLPWSHFLFAEGGSDEIRMAFSTHNIVVTGARLEKLLSKINSQQLDSLKESSRADGFGHSAEYQIAKITVEKCDG